MAVEARHFALPPQQIFVNSDTINCNGFVYNCGTSTGYGGLSGTTSNDNLLPVYGSGVIDSVPPKADSGLTNCLPVSRKRPRDSSTVNQSSVCFFNAQNLYPHQNNYSLDRSSLFSDDVSLQIQHQESEIDRLVTQCTENLKNEIEDRRKQNSRRLIAVIEQGIRKKLRAKDEEIMKISKLNWMLEEKVKSLCVENQIWRELAQTNETTANALRSNLEQVLAQINNTENEEPAVAAADNDAESCCESNYCEEHVLAEAANHVSSGGNCMAVTNRCRVCGKEESCVLVLPCRHLCLCTVCAFSVHICPICKSPQTATIHVNFT